MNHRRIAFGGSISVHKSFPMTFEQHRESRGPEVPMTGSGQSAIYFLELQGSLESYVQAKKVLHDYIVEESPDFPGGIMNLQF